MLNKYKITKQCLSTVLYIVFIISFSFYWECYWVWLSNNAYYYDWVEPFSEGFMDYNGFHLYDELTAADRHYFYYNDSVSWTWDISFIFNEAYYSKVWIKYTEDWYVWFLSWYSYADNIWFIKMSQFTNANNSQYANHYWDVDLSWDEQTEDVYWVWIDKRWNFHWKWKVESEPFYSENYNEWTTIWRPMPHDRDWDGVDNDDEDALISSPSWPDVDNDWIPNGENDWDSDWDLISDFDEVWIMSDPNNYLDKSNDSDWDYITDANEINIHWTDPLLFDSDHDWLNDKLEISLRLDPNNLDSDWDKIPDWIEYTMYKINTSFWDPWDKTVVISDTDQDLLPDQWENYYKNWSRSNLTGFIVTKDWKIPVDSKHDLSHINSASVANSNDKIDSLIDFDWDWLVNLEELYYWTNPNNWDIDWDNISDKDDPFPNDKCNQDPYCLNWSRTYWDKDQDWISDELEINWWEYATKWTVYDSDWDGLSDWYEKENSLNPLKKDTTWDWLSDWFGKYTESLWVWTTWNEGASFLESSWETLFETYINKLFE